MRPYRRMIFFILQVALILIPLGVHAQPTSQTLESITIQATLSQTGELQVDQDLVFVSPTPLSWPLFGKVNSLQVSSGSTALGEAAVSQKRSGDQTIIEAPGASSTWHLSYQTDTQLIRSKERDQLYLPLLRESGASADKLFVTFQLPTGTTSSGLVGNLYAIGGVGKTSSRLVDDHTLELTGQFIGPSAIVTLNAHWPKSVLRLRPTEEIRLALGNLEVIPWIVIGLFLPLFSFVVLLRLLARQRHHESKASPTLAAPPSTISPLIVGTLVDKKIYPKEIVALLIDLCRRGYVVIVKKSGQYYLSQRRPLDEHLESWERDILEALFPIANTKLTAEQMQALNKQSLFSPKVRNAFSDIYEIVTRAEFFAENPHLTRVRYKLFALFFYFLGVVGAMWIAITGASPYLLLPLGGTMLVCRLIIKYTPGLVRYTSSGLAERSNWLAFANYLAEPKPLPIESSRNQLFEKYLGYAVALNKTKEWAGRFDLSEMVIVTPDWFISYQETSTAQFAQEVEAFSRSISKMLTEMRGPLVS